MISPEYNRLKEVLDENNIQISELHAKINESKPRELSYNTLLSIASNKTNGNRNSQNKILFALRSIVSKISIEREDIFPSESELKKITIDNVFKRAGVPNETFVKPNEFSEIRAVINSNTCLSIEGPSGIGKTSCLKKLLDELNLFKNYNFYSARDNEDIETILDIAKGKKKGLFVIDDIHRLDEITKGLLTDRLKYIAEKDTKNEKIIILGINKVERSLFALSPDLVGRIKTIKFKQVDDSKLQELIAKGENALNISFDNKSDIIGACEGSFQLLQILCNIACSQDGIFEKQETLTTIRVDIKKIKNKLFDELANAFLEPTKKIVAAGANKQQVGRAPYLSILKMLSQSTDNLLSLSDIQEQDENVYNVVDNLVDSGKLEDHLNQEQFGNLIYFDKAATTIYAEDPKFFYYLKNLNWNDFAKKSGINSSGSSLRYDYALSFAGSEQFIAEKIAKELNGKNIPTFFYLDEQANMLGGNIGDYLKPVYESESEIIIPIISNNYARNFWTRFESNIIRDLISENRVIPILVDDAYIAIFDNHRDITSMVFSTKDDIDIQIEKIVRNLVDITLKKRNKKGS